MNRPQPLKKPRGTRDVLPDEAGRWQAIERTARDVFESFGYAEVRTPVFEDVALYQRSTGATSDIVRKEMYAFEDKKGRVMALRPEGTPGVVRAYIEGNLHKSAPQQKLYYIGSMFRYERPQAGREREFSQLGVEAIGYGDVATDFELISMVWLFYRKLGIPAESLTVRINSLGDNDERRAYGDELKEYLESKTDLLCRECIERLDRNPMRVFDCKNAGCHGIIDAAPRIGERLGPESAVHHARLKDYLAKSGIPFVDDLGLVRGLDYYTRTVFEVIHSGLGAQDALMGGGRYDGLIEQLGGPPTQAAGFAIGMSRTLLALEKEEIALTAAVPQNVYIAPVGDDADAIAAAISFRLAENGVRHVTGSSTKSFKAHLKAANRLGAKYAFIVGPDEVAGNVVTVRDLVEKTQEEMPMDSVMADPSKWR
jgi:histidyl-tRNA synthetase